MVVVVAGVIMVERDVGDGGCEEKGGSPWGPRKQVILSGSISCVKDAVFEGNLF